MNEASKLGVHTMSASDLESLRAGRLFLIVMGVALIVLGAVAMGSSLIATLATVLVFGLVLLLGAVFQVVTAFWAHRWRGFFLHMIAGVLYLVAGLFMIQNPVEAGLEASSFSLPRSRHGLAQARSGVKPAWRK